MKRLLGLLAAPEGLGVESPESDDLLGGEPKLSLGMQLRPEVVVLLLQTLDVLEHVGVELLVHFNSRKRFSRDNFSE